MDKQIGALVSGLALLTAVIGGTVTIENRYAKAEQVKAQMNDLWSKQLKLRILELQLKPSLTTSEKALLEHMQQELREATKVK